MAHYFLMLLFTDSSLAASYILLLLAQTLPTRSYCQSVHVCSTITSLCYYSFFVSFAILRALYFMVCTTQSIQIPGNNVFHDRTRHIEIYSHFIQQHVVRGTIRLISVSSSDQNADIFTKAHPPGGFHDLLFKLKLVSAFYHLEFEEDVRILIQSNTI